MFIYLCVNPNSAQFQSDLHRTIQQTKETRFVAGKEFSVNVENQIWYYYEINAKKLKNYSVLGVPLASQSDIRPFHLYLPLKMIRELPQISCDYNYYRFKPYTYYYSPNWKVPHNKWASESSHHFNLPLTWNSFTIIKKLISHCEIFDFDTFNSLQISGFIQFNPLISLFSGNLPTDWKVYSLICQVHRNRQSLLSLITKKCRYFRIAVGISSSMSPIPHGSIRKRIDIICRGDEIIQIFPRIQAILHSNEILYWGDNIPADYTFLQSYNISKKCPDCKDIRNQLFLFFKH